jgi:phospholipase C
MRTLLAAAAAAVGVWGAQAATGSLADVQHIVIFMQENRAFDHYYGVLRGVRGFTDRTAVRLAANGLPSFYQPIGDGSAYQLPFRVVYSNTSAQCMPSPTVRQRAGPTGRRRRGTGDGACALA